MRSWLSEPIQYSSSGIAVQSLDGSNSFYRIRSERLERREDGWGRWCEVPPEDILQHVILQTPVGTWLSSRLILQPAEWVKPYLHAAYTRPESGASL
jgi:hypothetical protein